MVVGAFRNSIALTFVVIGVLLTFPASVALWEQRTLASEEAFLSLGREIIDDEAVEVAIANAVSDEIIKRSGADTVRIRSAEFRIDQIALEVVRTLGQSEAGDLALRGVYMTSRRLANLDDRTVEVQGDDLVIDLRPTVREVVARVQSEEPVLANVTLPPDLGQITVTGARDFGIALDAWRAVDQNATLLILLPLVPFAIALIVASSRGFTLFLIGALIAGGAALRIFLLRGPIDSLLEDLITGESVYGDAGVSVYGHIVSSYTQQDVTVMIGGAVVAGLGLVMSMVLHR